MKFKLWRTRKQFYDNIPKSFTDTKKKAGYKSVSVSPDLTKRRYLLLREARESIRNNYGTDPICYCGH